MKTCFKCKTDKSLDDYYEHRGMVDGHLNKCISCTKEDVKTRKLTAAGRTKINKWRRKHYKQNPAKYSARRLQRVYGLTAEAYQNLLIKQGNLCAICEKPGQLVVDHDHKTGKVRGLLHRNCNSALGLLQDSVEIAASAASYLATKGVA